jgi:hypothetical protein
MHPNVSIIVSAAILRVNAALLGSVATEIVRLPARIDVSHQNQLPWKHVNKWVTLHRSLSKDASRVLCTAHLSTFQLTVQRPSAGITMCRTATFDVCAIPIHGLNAIKFTIRWQDYVGEVPSNTSHMSSDSEILEWIRNLPLWASNQPQHLHNATIIIIIIIIINLN